MRQHPFRRSLFIYAPVCPSYLVTLCRWHNVDVSSSVRIVFDDVSAGNREFKPATAMLSASTLSFRRKRYTPSMEICEQDVFTVELPMLLAI
ncbi:hypothetical protein [Pseudoalteromonas sp. TB64]|uniref:hypothetical protein n=1 Tax=Pseudoalteromonas sp. TB64 TaxID=1938600 RepID=UPI0020A65E4D|nr:hypothetical protein [Pseudoalteromonas sp. TB64]